MKSTREKFWLSDKTFPILVALACAAMVGGTHMYIKHGTGALNEIFVIQLLDQGLQTGDYAAAAGFAFGFLLARILEGPLVGLLDVGGSLMTGVGIGIPAVLLSAGYGKTLNSFALSLIIGGAIGIVIGYIIIGIRKLMPENVSAAGTGIMMGAGNATGRFLGPLIILSAVQYNVPAGLGSIIGAALFYKIDKPIAGGAILGSMAFAGLGLLI